MARKVFISYKYGDALVQALPLGVFGGTTTARHYVDVLQAHLDANDHINKGENDGEDLSTFKEETIESRLRAKIHDSTVTVVLISKGMKDPFLTEDDQWIPWEVSYSLKEHTRDGRTSSTNAIVAVVLPDEAGSYSYFIQENTCSNCNSRTLNTDFLFGILRENMFNRRQPKRSGCASHYSGSEPHIGNDHSYVYPVKWSDFVGDMNSHLDIALHLNANIDDFNLAKVIR